MSHIEEGKLHAYLDGELDARRRAALEEHLAICADCQERLEAARALSRRASELLAELEPGAVHVPPWREIEGRAAARERAAPPRMWVRPSLAWAAALAVAFGVGWFSHGYWGDVVGVRFAARQAEAPAPVAADRDAAAPMAEITGEFEAAGQAEAGRGALADRSGEPQVLGELRRRPEARTAEAEEAQPAGRREGAVATEADKLAGLAAAAAREKPGAPPAEAEAAPEEAFVADRVERAGDERAGEPLAQARERVDPARQQLEQQQPAGALARRTRPDVVGFRDVQPPEAAAGLAAAADAMTRGFAVPVEPEEAAVWLGADLRTLAGLELVEADVAPGSTVEGALPGLPAVRLTYQDAAGQRIVLIQQWLGARQADDAVSEPALKIDPDGRRAYRWHDERGYRLILQGTVSADSLRALAAHLN